MVNAEVAQDVKSTSDWDSLTKGPEVSEEPTKDAEYYRNNPKEIPNLASRLLELRGGLDAPVGTWDENLKTNVDEAGLPTTWVALIKYIKANPDAIDRVVTECERLEGGAGENDAGSIENGAAETEAVGDDSVEGAMDVAESAETEDEESDGWSTDDLSIPDFKEMAPEEKIDMLSIYADGVVNNKKSISLSNNIAEALKECSPALRTEVEYRRLNERIADLNNSIKENRKRVKALGLVLPGTKKAKELASLKTVISSCEKELKLDESTLVIMERVRVGKLSDDDQRLFDKVKALDDKSYGLLMDANARSYSRDIRYFEKSIREQERWMKDPDTGEEKKDDGTFARRKSEIAKWQVEIEKTKKKIAAYQAEHPNFILDEHEAAAAAKKKILAERAKYFAANDMKEAA